MGDEVMDLQGIEGPDLNVSKPAVDKKLYRQILLPNGLRCVLVCDTLALHQEFFYDDDDDEDDCEEDNDGIENKIGDASVEEEGADEDGEDDDSNGEDDGLRDAAAAMVVGVGSMFDPPEAQGLAHFLEHMLFMGTKKYPGENSYDAFLSKHGGSDNAYTEIEYTVFHLEIPQEKLFPALDMFSQFFIAPLMIEDAVERELNSIESEFQLSKNSDQCRLQQLMCHTSGNTPDEHPFAKFSWGNLKSLKEAPEERGVNIMQLLRQFYEQYYFAANMSLVVIGAYSLDELQRQVEACFSDIPASPRLEAPFEIKYSNIGTWDQAFETPMAGYSLPMKETSLRKIYRLIPVRDRHTLSVSWQVPSQIDNWRTQPCDYLAHLLGHEASGSILAALKETSWATGCYAGLGSDGVEFASSHALFIASFTLSEEGMKHWEEVVTIVFSYIGMLRHYCDHDLLPEWIQEELRLTCEIAYRYSDEEDPVDFVERLADRLAPHFKFPSERLLDGRDLVFDYDERAIQNLLDNYFTPKNVRIDLMSSNYGREGVEDSEGHVQTVGNGSFDPIQLGEPLEEPMFGTHYWCHDIPNDTLEKWDQAAKPHLPPPTSLLNLPPKNPYIPVNLGLKSLPADDGDHPLLNSSLKLCVSVGKQKSWFPATVVKFDSIQNKLLLSYEDEDEKWHTLDQGVSSLTLNVLVPGFEGTFDGKMIKFRLVNLAKDGEGAMMKYGDESDHAVETGSAFPAILPALPKSRLPKLVCDRPELKLWHLQDRKFRRPIAELRLRLVCSNANKSPLHQACVDLMVNLCADAVTEDSYLASVCDLGSSISNSELGFTVRVHGFDDKLLRLFETIFDVLLSFRGRSEADGLPSNIKAGRFEACCEVLKRRYENEGLKAHKLCSSVRIHCLYPESWSAHAKAEAIHNINEQCFTAVISEVMELVTAEALFHGNVDFTDAKAAESLILSALRGSEGGLTLSKKKFPKELVTQFPLCSDPYIITCPTKNLSEPNTAVEYYFQVGKDETKDRAMLDLLAHMMIEPFYDQLRTKDQFGYVVSCDSRWTSGVMGLYFSVVSSTKSADEITTRIGRFLNEYRKTLDNLMPEEFMEHLVGLAKNKLDMFNSLSEECDCYWSEIRDRRFDWEVRRHEALELRGFTKELALAAYDKWLLADKCRVLVVQVIGNGDGAAAFGRPHVEGSISAYIDEQVRSVHKSVGGNTWGKVY